MIVQQGKNLSENIGRLTIAYIGDTNSIRVILSNNGQCIREDQVEQEDFTLQDFRKIVKSYKAHHTP